jgi:hypothetical protein
MAKQTMPPPFCYKTNNKQAFDEIDLHFFTGDDGAVLPKCSCAV